jgi:hypothetical protein
VANGDGSDALGFALPPNAPMGMRNNNPLNIKYYRGAPYAGLVGPSVNTDQGDPQMVFATPQHGWNAAYSLLNQKYNAGKTTPNAMIAGAGGWTPGNYQAAANVAKAAGIAPNQDIGFSDPARAQSFMRALVTQEQGGAARAYPDAMISGAISGTPVKFASTPKPPGTTLNTSAPLPAAPSPSVMPHALMVAQNAPVSTTPGNASAGASGSPASVAATTAAGAAGAGGSGTILPGFGTAQASNDFMQGATNLDKAMMGQAPGGQSAGGQSGQPMQPSQMIPGPAPHLPNPQLAAQTYGQTLNSMRTPPQWGANPPGSPISATAGPQGGMNPVAAQQMQELQQQLQMQMMMGGGMGNTLGYGGMGYG